MAACKNHEKASTPTRGVAGSRLKKTRARIEAERPAPPLGAGLLSDLAWREVTRSLGLSGREVEVTRGIFDNDKEVLIARKLGLSEHTVHTHVNRLFKKLGASSRAQVVVRVVQEFLLLTLPEGNRLPPMSRRLANGECPLGTKGANRA